MKRCMYCGHENEDTASECEICGNKLAEKPDGGDYTGLNQMPAENAVPAAAEAAGDRKGGEAASDEAAPANIETKAQDGTQPVPPSPEQPASAALPQDVLPGPEAVSQPAAFAGQTPVNEQFSGTVPAGQFAQSQGPMYETAEGYVPQDLQQDVGRGQTYAARQQLEGRSERPDRRRSSGNAQYGDAGYGYRQPQAGGQVPPAEARAGYGRNENAGGGKSFMVRSRKRVKSFLFFMMALTFTAMVATNVYNLISGNALYNLSQADAMLENILGGTNSFATQTLSELAKQLVSMVVNVNDIVQQLGQTVVWGILFVFLVPNAFYALGLWLMFGQTDTRRRQFSMGGYTLAKVMMILKFIIACLVLAIGLVISVYFVVVGASSAKFTSSFIEGLMMLVLMIVIAVLTVMYYVQWLFCLKVVKLNAKTGADPGRMPGYVAVISILAALFEGALMIPMAPDDYVGLAARGCLTAYFLFSGLWVISYKLRVKRG